MPVSFGSGLYNLFHPERTPLCQSVAEHYETWLELASAGQFDGQGGYHKPKASCCGFSAGDCAEAAYILPRHYPCGQCEAELR